ncbi:MAG: DNA translocase FtsK 4TM domain-containing protein [Ferruginibacter sp.]
MADKIKSIKKNTKAADTLKPEKEETVEVKQLLKDERTHKIAGSICLLLALLFFVAFTSYLFTWEEDFDKVHSDVRGMFLGTETKVANLMGTFGAFISYFLIYKGFGVASYLFCTFFFILGINLFFGKKVFSVVRNLKYLVIGLPLISITASVIMQGNGFAWGGAVGDMCRDYLFNVIGKIGTIGIIAVAFLAYIIWTFNPVFKLPSKKIQPVTNDDAAFAEEESGNESVDKETQEEQLQTGNAMTGNAALLNIPDQSPQFDHELSLTEKEEETKRGTRILNTVVLPQKTVLEPVLVKEPEEAVAVLPKSDLELEVKTVPDAVPEEDGKTAADVKALKPYDPVLDLRDYKFPSIELLENHGSEKIVQDPQELENNKNQIINTLKNYDINIQKISATVGPTVTLYEIIPAAGVRISRIKNLEDDIALSLAALGIRIIAPIPGKGTIGIEVPNTRKTIVSMKTLLSSDKFINSSYSLPIAIGKRIDNENFIVDLASMPHLLMARLRDRENQ